MSEPDRPARGGRPLERAPVVEARSVTKRFGNVTALADATVAFHEKRLIAVLGPNGAGKTTLLDLLLGLTTPDEGEILLFGSSPRPYPRRRVGAVLQREFVMEGISVAEYAELFAAIQGVRDGASRIVREAELEDRAKISVHRLSGGEAARLFLAAAVVHGPELLLLDEPTAPLDPESKRRIGTKLRELARERTVILSTHDLREADALADDLLFLVGGRVRAFGSREDLVAAVPEGKRTGNPVEDAFFHFCSVRLRGGEIDAEGP
jgi:ABC-2 type transport system ATP-binding protein